MLANESVLNAEPTETPEATTGIAVTELSEVTPGGTGRSDAVESTTGTSGDVEDGQGDSSAGTDVEQRADCATGTSVDKSGDVQAEHQSGPQGNDGAGTDVEKQVAGGGTPRRHRRAGPAGIDPAGPVA